MRPPPGGRAHVETSRQSAATPGSRLLLARGERCRARSDAERTRVYPAVDAPQAPALPMSVHGRLETVTEGLAIGVPRPDGSVVVECDASVHGHGSAVLRDRREGGHAAESVVAIGPHRACLAPELSEDVL